MTEKQLNPLTAETLWKLRRLGPPALSPDGARVADPVSSDDTDADETRTEIWLVAADGTGSRPFTTQSATGGRPAWSPDGRFIAFVAKRVGDQADQLYVAPVDGGEARRITSFPTGASAPKWFPDSRLIAFISRVWMTVDESGTSGK